MLANNKGRKFPLALTSAWRLRSSTAIKINDEMV
jgi:hypothetical protein